MKSYLFFAICLVTFLISCEEKKTAEQDHQSQPPILVNEVLISNDNCHQDSTTCTFVYIEYPEFSDSAKLPLNELISSRLRTTTSEYFREEVVDGTFEHIAQSFIQDYKSFKIDFPDYQIGWYVKVFSEITYESEEIMSFRIDSESYTGGAHPNSRTAFYVIDKQLKSELSTSDIIADTSKFKNMLEAEFRRLKGISGDQSFADRGYYINDGDFLLNNNIGISDTKIMVHFNPYEIAPYAEGATTIEMNKTDLKGILKID